MVVVIIKLKTWQAPGYYHIVRLNHVTFHLYNPHLFLDGL